MLLTLRRRGRLSALLLGTLILLKTLSVAELVLVQGDADSTEDAMGDADSAEDAIAEDEDDQEEAEDADSDGDDDDYNWRDEGDESSEEEDECDSDETDDSFSFASRLMRLSLVKNIPGSPRRH